MNFAVLCLVRNNISLNYSNGSSYGMNDRRYLSCYVSSKPFDRDSLIYSRLFKGTGREGTIRHGFEPIYGTRSTRIRTEWCFTLI